MSHIDLIPDGTMARPYRPPLGQVLETLGSDVLSAAHVPDAGLPIGEPVVHDPDDQLEDRPACVLLAVGARPSAPEAHELVRQAGARNYHAVVIKDRGADLGELIDAAREARVALLVASAGIPWRQLDALLTAAISGPGAVTTTYSSVGMGDLFALANAIATTIGGATCVEDAQGNVLAYSNVPSQEIDEIRKQGILGRKTPLRPTNRLEYSRVFRADGPVRFASLGPGHMRRLATAVRAGAQLLGFIWVLDGSPSVIPGAMRLLEDAGRIAAPHMLRSRNPSDPQRWQRAETFRALLDDEVSESAAAARLGLPPDSSVAIMAFAPARPLPQSAGAGAAVTTVVDLVSLACEAWHHEAVCTASWSAVYAMVPVPEGTTPARLVRFAADTAGSVRKSVGISLHVGVGPVAARLEEVPSSRRLADRVVRVLAETAGDAVHVATDEQVRSRIALLELVDRGDTAADRLLEPVRRMLEYDAAHSAMHAATLLAYLDAFGEAARAAAELSVHENTLRYRVRRLQELFGVDLADPTERLVIWLQLRLLHMRGEFSSVRTRLPGWNVRSQR
ncbi:helix-turn-helix domain-containing protein [Microtetraspora sp. NBRC 16547]|uniref:PucR family transcriptional regulator n=1 Tax=Microtetraspora sp. NBRC 16547 TaxID=3030993 RepID=UPI0024A49527|nr:helix-turn-helix domain-containing protein [Microtetraspora sp. NBRC 16547]GLW99424.1 DNA-binding protein [Microtetraspora sp. NBRC 16547]